MRSTKRRRMPPCAPSSSPALRARSRPLPATVGWQQAAEVLLTGDWIDAARAVELGIASRLCAPDELLPAMQAVAARIALQAPQAVRATKRLLMATRADSIRAAREREDRAFAERIGSAENMEAIAAFFEKRPPDFSRL